MKLSELKLHVAEISQKRIVILGGGESGMGAAVLAQQQGFDVFLSDNGKLSDEHLAILRKYNIAYEEGGHTRELILNANEVIKSPGIPDYIPIVEAVRKQKIPIISEIEFAGRYCTAKRICITGSNGKTTTSSLIYFLLKNAGLNVGLAGNIGKSYAYQVATEKFDYYVIELSSFQLDGMTNFKADIAVLLNITPDHLDRYDNQMQNYVNSKFRITQNMRKEDCFIFCSDDEITMRHLKKIVLKTQMLSVSQTQILDQGAYLFDERLVTRYQDSEFEILIKELALGGRHNVYNSMVAAVAGKVLDIRNSVIRESLMGFKGVEHRLEFVSIVNGIKFVNDSKATNVNSAWYALESMADKVVWIVGGTDKGNDYSSLYELVKKKVKAIVCLGLNNKKIIDNFKDFVPTIVETKSAKAAVQKAHELSQPGYTVLLSPACASFDLFHNYEDRGRQFKQAVQALK
ncbi:MAG: UDP-N-acetylmuramoyl-L-alanine--D-glutamate ligase [Prevotellaceae bacterium]|jgi:UDP-N-acetylmuramoylalanine--D-glutamate ligase|nr:UDP-N-acetylmuramoyl-L-alanine--D-glutamate ligase [Prevotellaceae bacterium]